jgi:hypothetical protein
MNPFMKYFYSTKRKRLTIMPIKGLTDRGPSLPQIGELRKGGEKPAAGNKPGPDLKYFRFTSKHPEVERLFYDCYPDGPTAVNCYFPFQTAAENFDAWVEDWGAGSLKWRGDGETLVLWQKKDGSYSQEPQPQPAGGRKIGRLKIIIPELKRLAYVTALTSSVNDIMTMPSVLEAYEAMRGDLRGIPFVLSRVPQMVSTPGTDGKRVRREKWLWHLEAQPVWVQAQLSVMQRAALPAGVALLDSGAIADIETGEILDDDYEEGEVTAVVEQKIETAEPDPLITDCRTWLEDKIQDGKTNLGMVLDAAVMTELYPYAEEVLDVVKQFPTWPKSYRYERGQVLKGASALAIFDWLVEQAEI